MHQSSLLDMELVISGISGRFPQSSNIQEFSDNLLSGIDMITQSRWTPALYGLPKRNGILKDLSKFDHEFFKFTKNEANEMDPMLRLLMEVTFEAIFDSGVNPTTLRGSRTGVFVGAAKSEAGEIPTRDYDTVTENTLFGHSRGMFANGMSHAFDFHGPSLTVETACSSSLLALERAISAIRLGQCDGAIVCGSNLLLKPQASVEFHRLNMLSQEGKCKAFDASGNGYVRSESIVAILIQKKSSAHKLYAEIIHARSNVDGSKEEGITYPSGKMQKNLLEEVYAEARVKPSSVTYIEAHGTGTRVGDPQEVNAIADFFCQDRDANFPLLIGSVKSNMGHAEHASGLCSIAKILVAITQQIIPGNLHYENPNLEIPSLTDGRLKVVDKNVDWDGGIVGINSFGFGGANVHVILNVPKFSSEPEKLIGNTPMLVNLSGNDEVCLRNSMHRIASLNVSSLELINNIARDNVPEHSYRSFLVLTDELQSESEIVVENFRSESPTNEKRPVWFVFSGMGSQWTGMGKDLMKLKPFKESIDECATILRGVDLNLYEILLSDDETVLENTTNSFVGIAAVQIAMIDTLHSVGIIPDGFLGHSVGENVCAYADGISTKEETLLVPFFAGMIFQNANLPAGGMAAVGLSWEETKLQCPKDIFPACNNCEDNVSVAGPIKSIREFVEILKRKGIFAREIKSGQAFHSAHISSTKRQLIDILNNNGIFKKPKKHSCRWISTSIPESERKFENSGFISPEYFANNLVSPVLFHEAIKFIPNNAIVIEVGPHALLQSLLKRALPPTCSIIVLSNKTSPNNEVTFLNGIGKLYLYGQLPIVAKLYGNSLHPQIFPASGFLSPYVAWNHSTNFTVPDFEKMDQVSNKLKEVSLNSSSGFKIGDTYYLSPMLVIQMILNAYAEDEKVDINCLNVRLENVVFHKQFAFKSPEDPYQVSIRFLKGSGKFEVLVHEEAKTSVFVTGQIMQLEQASKTLNLTSIMNSIHLDGEGIYKEFSLLGYEFEDEYKMIESIEIIGNQSTVQVINNNTGSMLDALLQLVILLQPRFGNPMIVSGIGKLTMNVGNFINFSDRRISTSYLKNQCTIESSFCKIENIELTSILIEKSYNSNNLISLAEMKGNQAYGYINLNNPIKIVWLEGPANVKNFKPQDHVNFELCKVQYAGLDSKLVSNQIGLGKEFSGVTYREQRVMGLVPDFALATQVLVETEFLWEIPQDWTFEEACSVPFAYAISYYALIVRGEIRPVDSILILPCPDGIDEACIRIASSINCDLYIAVESKEKQDFWTEVFPELKLNFIPLQNFQYAILERTNGNGVSVVLNSFSDSKINSALECTAMNGRFLHICSQSQSINNNTIGMATFLKNISFEALVIESIFTEIDCHKKNLHNHFMFGLQSGVVKPLACIQVFASDEYQNAVIHQSKGRKSIIKIPDLENLQSISRQNFSPKDTFIIIEPELRLGIDLLYYLTERGARAIHFILQNTNGIQGMEEFHLQKLKSQGIEVTISIEPYPIRENLCRCIKLLLKTRNIHGVFVLDDCKMEEFEENNQEWLRNWILPMTSHFDILTRNYCSLLYNFMIISKPTNQHAAFNVLQKIAKARINDGMPCFIWISHNTFNKCKKKHELGKFNTKDLFYTQLDQVLDQRNPNLFNATMSFDLACIL